jgi:hypothetical protein
MWVSTAIVGSPNAVLRMTLAVLRPTPGSSSSSARVRGTAPPWCATKRRHVSMTLWALLLNNPRVRMCSRTPSVPSASIASAVGAAANKLAVAALTPRSVDCADRMTAMSSWNGVA